MCKQWSYRLFCINFNFKPSQYWPSICWDDHGAVYLHDFITTLNVTMILRGPPNKDCLHKAIVSFYVLTHQPTSYHVCKWPRSFIMPMMPLLQQTDLRWLEWLAGKLTDLFMRMWCYQQKANLKHGLKIYPLPAMPNMKYLALHVCIQDFYHVYRGQHCACWWLGTWRC